MTDEQIIKALEYLIGLSEQNKSSIVNFVHISAIKDALDLINRQQAEIERLEKGELSKAMTFNSHTIKRCVNEAIKEFIAEFERRCIDGGIYPAFVKRQLEHVKEEMVGDKE